MFDIFGKLDKTVKIDQQVKEEFGKIPLRRPSLSHLRHFQYYDSAILRNVLLCPANDDGHVAQAKQ